MLFITTLETFAPISEACKAALDAVITSKHYKKGHIILEFGDVSTKLYFIDTGLARVYYDTDTDTDTDTSKEIISWFGYEGGFLCSPRSYLSQIPSDERIQLLEDSTLYAIKHSDLERLFVEYPELNLVFRLIAQHFIKIYDARTHILRERTPEKQYEAFHKLYPKLGSRAKVSHIAAYLSHNISTISRVRGKIANRK